MSRETPASVLCRPWLAPVAGLTAAWFLLVGSPGTQNLEREVDPVCVIYCP